jgi:hypothetical protein
MFYIKEKIFPSSFHSPKPNLLFSSLPISDTPNSAQLYPPTTLQSVYKCVVNDSSTGSAMIIWPHTKRKEIALDLLCTV